VASITLTLTPSPTMSKIYYSKQFSISKIIIIAMPTLIWNFEINVYWGRHGPLCHSIVFLSIYFYVPSHVHVLITIYIQKI